MLCIQVPIEEKKVNEYLSIFFFISFTVRLHDSIQEENYHYLVFDLYVEKYLFIITNLLHKFVYLFLLFAKKEKKKEKWENRKFRICYEYHAVEIKPIGSL